MTSRDAAVRAYNALPQEPGTLRFFKRLTGYVMYEAYGADAEIIARGSYGPVQVERLRQIVDGTSMLRLSVSLFAHISRFLLQSSASRIALHGEESFVRQWTASPGHQEPLERELMNAGDRSGAMAGVENMNIACLAFEEPVGSNSESTTMCSHALQLSLHVGACAIDSGLRTLTLFETTELSADLAELEGFVVREGCREILVLGGSSNEDGSRGAMTALHKMALRCGVLLSPAPSPTASRGNYSLATLLASSSEFPPSEMALALRAAEDAVVHLGLSPDVSGIQAKGAGNNANLQTARKEGTEGAWSFSIDTLEGHLLYDADVAHALRLFPHSCGRPSSDGALVGSVMEAMAPATSTGGARRLLELLRRPLSSKTELERRHEAVGALVKRTTARARLRGRDCLGRMPDLHRCLGATASTLTPESKPRSLKPVLDMYRALIRSRAVLETLNSLESEGGSSQSVLLKGFASQLESLLVSVAQFEAMVEEVIDLDEALIGSNRGRIKASFTPGAEAAEAQRIAAEQAIHAATNAVTSALESHGGPAKKKRKSAEEVKVECSSVHGLHFKVPKSQGSGVLSDGSDRGDGLAGKSILAVHRSGVLFTTSALKAAASASEKANVELSMAQASVVNEVLKVTASYSSCFRSLDALLSEVDAFAALAETAATLGWCCPTLVEAESQIASEAAPATGDPVELTLFGLRHPLVEGNLARAASSSSYSSSSVASGVVPNDVNLGTGLHGRGRVAIVTGPNCGGKSTLITAVGITQYLAQCGSFVPCTRAIIPLVRRLLARTGATEAPTHGISSFMAEMLETATLLRRAGPRTLCLIDELGRGTSTHDGLGVAWAVALALSRCGCTALFASHFHELTALREYTEGAVQNLHMMVQVTPQQGLTFSFQVRPGACDKSFGVQVASLANFPPSVVKHADAILLRLEGRQNTSVEGGRVDVITRNADQK